MTLKNSTSWEKPPTFWLPLKAKQKSPVIKGKWKITDYYMVLHSLQKLQVLTTKWAPHLSHYWRGQPEHRHSLPQSLLVWRLLWPGSCSQHKGNNKWPDEDWGPRAQVALQSCHLQDGLCSKAVFALRYTWTSLQQAEGRSDLYLSTKAELSLLQSVLPGSAGCLLS